MLPRASCMPFHSIVHARLYISCIHAYHAYCIVFGVGVSPGTGNEVRFVLRVTERVSIHNHRHSGLSMMELGLVVFICAFILYWVAQLNSSAIMHRYAWLVTRGSRHAYICENTLLCPFPALCCSKSRISNLPELGTLSKKNYKTEANRGIPVDFRARQPRQVSSIRVKAVPGLHASV